MKARHGVDSVSRVMRMLQAQDRILLEVESEHAFALMGTYHVAAKVEDAVVEGINKATGCDVSFTSGSEVAKR